MQNLFFKLGKLGPIGLLGLMLIFALAQNANAQGPEQGANIGDQFSVLFTNYPIATLLLALIAFLIGYLLGKSGRRLEHGKPKEVIRY